MKKKLLVTGASGFLGWNVCTFPQSDWSIYGTYHSNNNLPKTVESIPLDLTDTSTTTELVQSLKPDAILHLAANSSTYLCEESPKDTESINVATPILLGKLAAKTQAQLLFTSSEQVFDGTHSDNKETDYPNPKNAYGKQKRAAELALLKYPKTCIVRIAVLFGNAGAGNRNFMHEWLKKWENGEAITVFHDELRSFLSGQSAAEGLFQLLNQEAKGIFHLAGADTVSRLEFAKLLKEHCKIPSAKIISKSQKEVNTLAFRPANLGLDCQNAEKLGFVKRPIQTELAQLF